MKIIIKNELLFLNFIVFALIAFVLFFPDNPLRVIFGIPVVAFLPGYALLSTLFPRKTQISGMERVILSFVLSLAIVPLIALILNFTSFGVRLGPVLYVTSGFIVFNSVIAWLRRRRQPTEDCYKIECTFVRPTNNWRPTIGSLVLLVMILISGTFFGFLATHPQHEEPFSEFYLLPASSEAYAQFPSPLFVGKEAEVRVGIKSHELSAANYQIDVMVNESFQEKIETSLLPGEQFLQTTSFVFDKPDLGQQVEFILYKDGVTYMKPLYLWIDVK